MRINNGPVLNFSAVQKVGWVGLGWAESYLSSVSYYSFIAISLLKFGFYSIACQKKYDCIFINMV